MCTVWKPDSLNPDPNLGFLLNPDHSVSETLMVPVRIKDLGQYHLRYSVLVSGIVLHPDPLGFALFGTFGFRSRS